LNSGRSISSRTVRVQKGLTRSVFRAGRFCFTHPRFEKQHGSPCIRARELRRQRDAFWPQPRAFGLHAGVFCGTAG
jgi:hypothetical protein